MTKIHVISRKGRLLEIIKRKTFIGKDRHGFPESHVKYKGKEYPTYNMKGTNVGGLAIYPYGTGKK